MFHVLDNTPRNKRRKPRAWAGAGVGLGWRYGRTVWGRDGGAYSVK